MEAVRFRKFTSSRRGAPRWMKWKDEDEVCPKLPALSCLNPNPNPNPAARPGLFSANELSPYSPETSQLRETGTTGFVVGWWRTEN